MAEAIPRHVHYAPDNLDPTAVRPVTFDDGFYLSQSQQDRKEGIEDCLLEDNRSNI